LILMDDFRKKHQYPAEKCFEILTISVT
jgi:hypothetical protein